MDLQITDSEKIAKVFSIFGRENVNPLDPAWQRRVKGVIKEELKVDSAEARGLLLRGLVAFDFIGRHRDKLVQERYIAASLGATHISAHLLAVLARAPIVVDPMGQQVSMDESLLWLGLETLKRTQDNSPTPKP